MDRRNFITKTATCLGLFTILPPATTYKRIWKAVIKSDQYLLNQPINNPVPMEGVITIHLPSRYVITAKGEWIGVPYGMFYDTTQKKLVPIDTFRKEHEVNPSYKNPYA